MFSNNERISVRQMKRLLVLDWLGKLVLLIPGFLSGTTGRDLMLAIFVGTLLSIFYGILVCRLSQSVTEGMPAYLTKRFGKMVSFLLCLVFAGYLLINLIYISRVFGALSVAYVLPEMSANIPCVLLLLGGACASIEPKERRGRVGEVLYPFIIIPIIILLFIAATGIKEENFTSFVGNWTTDPITRGGKIFIVYGSLSLLLFEAPHIQRGKFREKTVIQAIVITSTILLTLLLLGIGTFGENGIRALQWPFITLMSNVEIPGGFLQRFDIVFIGLLLGGFFVAASSGLYYLNLMVEEWTGKTRRPSYSFLVLLLVVIGTIWCKDANVAEELFLKVNGYLLMPIMTGFTILMAILEWERRRRGEKKK